MDIRLLKPYKKNAKKHPKKQVQQVADSIKEFGFNQPIVIDKNNVVIVGHGRLEAAKLLGLQEVPVLQVDLTKEQADAYRLADNKLNESDWDMELVIEELKGLDASGFDIELTGFDKDLIIEPDEKDDQIPDVPEEPVSKLGDLYQLGEHRLLCGDATKIEDVERLMDGQKADITFTSPPYNAGKTPKEQGKYLNDTDDKTTEEYKSLLNAYVLRSLEYTDYVFSNVQSLSGNKIALIEHLYELREKFADTIVWNKENAQPAMARRVLNSQFEYIHIFSNEAKRSIGKRDFRGTVSNVFSINNNAGKEHAKIHKATFRVEVPLHFIEQFTESSVYDPFGGTGTTLIAAEKTNRKCYMMELDPRYVDVIVKRWEEYTGQNAVKL